MSGAARGPASVKAVEALMLEKFRTEPFHNLHLLYAEHQLPGGTCSDKTLSFLSAARQVGFDAALHSGFIGGKEIHRLARVRIDGRDFFADVGGGWPALMLYPADRPISYSCFGMNFRTEISASRLTVFHTRQGKETSQLEIEVHGRPESEIRADIARRFTSGVVYPFSSSVRFSMVVGDRFLFLRGDQLQIYRDDGVEIIHSIEPAEVPRVIRSYLASMFRRCARKTAGALSRVHAGTTNDPRSGFGGGGVRLPGRGTS